MLTESSRERPPILILGAHRSGTSATAVALQLLGLQIGQRLDSHAEPRPLQRFHEDYLRLRHATWWRPAPFLRSLQTNEGMELCVAYLRKIATNDFAAALGYRKNLKGRWLRWRRRSGASWGWKEPRTTLFAPAWLQLFPAARILHVTRHPIDVALSIQRRELQFRSSGDRPNEGLDELENCFDLAIEYLTRGEALASQTDHYRRIRFEDLQASPGASLKTLADFVELNPSARQLSDAARTIAPERAGRWKALPEETTDALLAKYPIAAALGYA